MEGVSGKISPLPRAEFRVVSGGGTRPAVRPTAATRRPGAKCVTHVPPRRLARGCIWQCHVGGESVGILGLIHVGRHVVRLCPFRIDPQWQHTAALTRLLQRAHEYCWNHSCLKVLVEEGSAPQWLLTSWTVTAFTSPGGARRRGKLRDGVLPGPLSRPIGLPAGRAQEIAGTTNWVPPNDFFRAVFALPW